MTEQYEYAINDAVAIGERLQSAHSIENVQLRTPPESGGHPDSIRYALYIADDCTAGEVITQAQLEIANKPVDSWIENPGNGGVVVIGVGGLNPSNNVYPPLKGYELN